MIKLYINLKTTHKVLLLFILFLVIFSGFFLILLFSPDYNHEFENLNDVILNNFIVSFYEVVFIFIVFFLLVVFLSYSVIKTDKLESIVNVDELTNVQTRRSFFSNNGDNGKRTFDYLILIIDIDYFKSVNDSFGHEVGDKYLMKFGQELKKIGVDSLNSVRLGGEEFGLIFNLKDIEKKYKGFTLSQKINKFSKSIHKKLNSIFLDDNKTIIQKTCSFGSAILRVDDKISDSLSYADNALQVVKKNGRNNYKFADDKFIATSKELNEIITLDELSEALKKGQLSFYFQPIIDIKNNSIKFFECLIRWTKPNGTILLPKEFLSKFIHLNARSIKEGTRIWRTVFDKSFKNINIDKKIKFSINFQMSHFANIGAGKLAIEEVEYIKTLIDNEIIVEITEVQNTRIDDVVANKEIGYIKDQGVSVALDDYGVKGSNLERLINTPWNIIKLDKQLIDNVVTNRRSRVAVEGIKTMATRLNNQIIAEGVETKEQLKYLKEIGINLIQGFLISKPMPGSEIESFAKQFNAKYN